jgi:hypothetical protein
MHRRRWGSDHLYESRTERGVRNGRAGGAWDAKQAHCAPNPGYRILPWFDLNPDGLCTGTTAATFPGNPTVTTSNGGSGELHVELSRGAPFVDGVRFDVRSRVVDLAGNTVLQGDCFTGTLK